MHIRVRTSGQLSWKLSVELFLPQVRDDYARALVTQPSKFGKASVGLLDLSYCQFMPICWSINCPLAIYISLQAMAPAKSYIVIPYITLYYIESSWGGVNKRWLAKAALVRAPFYSVLVWHLTRCHCRCKKKAARVTFGRITLLGWRPKTSLPFSSFSSEFRMWLQKRESWKAEVPSL